MLDHLTASIDPDKNRKSLIPVACWTDDIESQTVFTQVEVGVILIATIAVSVGIESVTS